MSVWMKPGAMALAVMLRLATSRAMDYYMNYYRPDAGESLVGLPSIADQPSRPLDSQSSRT